MAQHTLSARDAGSVTANIEKFEHTARADWGLTVTHTNDLLTSPLRTQLVHGDSDCVSLLGLSPTYELCAHKALRLI
jgi:hypothetical protein